MSSLRERIGIAISAAVVAGGLFGALSPPKPGDDLNDLRRQQQEQAARDLADAHERELRRRRDAADDYARAERERRSTPVIPRPPDEPRIRIRIP